MKKGNGGGEEGKRVFASKLPGLRIGLWVPSSHFFLTCSPKVCLAVCSSGNLISCAISLYSHQTFVVTDLEGSVLKLFKKSFKYRSPHHKTKPSTTKQDPSKLQIISIEICQSCSHISQITHGHEPIIVNSDSECAQTTMNVLGIMTLLTVRHILDIRF